ncbi:glycosyltransferase [Shewanella chilikensis]|uniref:glycosyltransferase n=1 Tax=Shewanella chilikensis TaxID=558541 RepID=UPI001CD7E62A|nr:glycosyltransferase [Shewanella chilikensis]MCA0950244.1 glycosyltransferase [Shewanella chilikensis]
MKVKENIIIFTTDMYQGGVAESTRKLCKLLSNTYQVILIIYDHKSITKDIDKNVRVIQLNAPLSVGFENSKFSKRLVKLVRYPLTLYVLFSLIFLRFKYQPKACYSMTYVPNIINIISGRLFKLQRTIVSERQDPIKDLGYSGILSKTVRYFYPKADVIHANSLGLVDSIKEFYKIEKNIFRIDNFFFEDELKMFSKEKVTLKGSSKFNIVTAGRLSPQKGHWHLIECMKFLKDSNVALHILGDGELKNELTALVNKLDLTSNVYFYGNVPNPHPYVEQSNMFIFPSIWESFGNSLVEAMFLSKPVASTSCVSGPKEIIDQGRYGLDLGLLSPYGEVMPESTYSDLANKIINIITDDGLVRFYSEMALRRSIDYGAMDAKKKLLKMFEGEL